MCGIAGFLNWNGFSSDASADLRRMTDAIAHRGPDDEGAWTDGGSGVALGQRRLAIVDLSPAGHQPMISHCGRYILVLNGEIYNHRELRKDIDDSPDPVSWRGHSDSEVFLETWVRHGAEETLKRSVGMFAIAVWDRAERSLTLARDRMGEKPLYYGWQNGILLFGSELAALKAHPAFVGVVDRNSLSLMMRHNYIPAPYSIYRDIMKVLPGHVLTLHAGERDPRVACYWNAAEHATRGRAHPFTGTAAEAVDQVEQHLRNSLQGQMMADVPLGAFLSGGIDSSTIAALMQSMSSTPVRTFSIGFDVPGYNEAEHAKAVAQHLGTAHTELYVTGQDALNVIPSLPSIYSEPFSDSSQIPTFLVSQMARRDVTVCLSGDAGDELFSGYSRYHLTENSWEKLSRVPKPVRQAVAALLKSIPVSGWNAVLGPLLSVGPSRFRHGRPGDRLHKIASVIGSSSPTDIYRQLVSHWDRPEDIVIGGREPATQMTGLTKIPAIKEFLHEMMYLDAVAYLPDDILVKVDRAAMAVALEGRVPMLDHRLVEFAWSLPTSILRKDGMTKWPLRQVLYRYVPAKMIERPKMGFGVPIDSWLRGPLRDWAENLLDEGRLRRDGFFRPEPIRQKWAEHLSGKRNWQYHLWDVLCFQAWLESEQS
nr:asparagine synthase (glutamine-hydrolyzing) [uncultured Gellertiella sp.]